VAGEAVPSRWWGKALARAGVVLILVFVYLAGRNGWFSGGSATAHSRPYEYVYLDSARVESYLGQVIGGNIGSESRSETTTNNSNVGVQVEAVGSAGASTSKQLTTSAVVTLTEADRFYKLLDDLKADNALTTVDVKSEALSPELEGLQEGAMVRIENAFIHLPPYLSAYPQLRYASYDISAVSNVFETPALSKFGPSEVELVHRAKAAREAFMTRVGANPRIPFTVSPPGTTIVIPAHFVDLTGDPSLLSTNLTVVGKVVYNGLKFGDAASQSTYLPALLGASSSLLGYLGVKKQVLENLRLPRSASRHSREAHEATFHKLLFGALENSLSYAGRVVEVIPVAMYD
jgi:hypothetical protein